MPVWSPVRHIPTQKIPKCRPPRPLRVPLSPIVLYALAPTTNPMTVPTKNPAKSLAGLPLFASILINPQGVSVVPVTPPQLPPLWIQQSRTLQLPRLQTVCHKHQISNPRRSQQKKKVEQRQQKQRPTVSTPLDVDKLALELVNHPIDLLLIT